MNHPIKVTITGADESVHPAHLVEIGTDFPGVEWAILYSRKREGSPRYPGAEWRSTATGMFASAKKSALALHVCGEAARQLMAGERNEWLRILTPYKRLQVNGWLSSARHTLVGVPRDTELILQARAPKFLSSVMLDAITLGNASVLFDPSGGEGVHPEAWPKIPATKLRVGIAGGITPDNVTAVLEATKDQPIAWIDMESGVRTNDVFDLAKVRSVLEQVKAWNGRMAS